MCAFLSSIQMDKRRSLSTHSVGLDLVFGEILKIRTVFHNERCFIDFIVFRLACGNQTIFNQFSLTCAQ